MGREREADFYIGDGVPKLPLHKMASQFLDDVLPDETIVELGCGAGFLAEALVGRKYIGIDFSNAMLAKAGERTKNMKFILADLRDTETFKIYKEYRVFILIEVLEHIIADCEIINSIPHGSLVVFSVPSFNSAGHVRCFKNEKEIKDRYSKWLDFEEVKILPIPNYRRNKIFIFKARRR